MRRLVLVEFQEHDGGQRPFRVEVSKGRGMATFDFEWCKRDQTLYYDETGGGPDDGTIYVDRLVDGARAKLWIHPDYQPVANSAGQEPVPDVSVLGWDRVPDEPADPFKDAVASDTVYCETCDDWLPDQDHCDHVWWCDADGWWRGAVDDESMRGPCDDAECDSCAGHRP